MLQSRSINSSQSRFQSALAACLRIAEQRGEGTKIGEPSLDKDRQPVADLCDLGQGMGDDKHGSAGVTLLVDDLLEQLPRIQVKAFHRLVENEQVRLGDQGLRESQTLDHSLAVAGNRFMGTVRQSDSLKQPRHASLQNRLRSPGHLATEGEQGGGIQIPGKRLILVHVSNAGECAPLGNWLAEPEHPPAAGMTQAQKNLEEGRLACPVRA